MKSQFSSLSSIAGEVITVTISTEKDGSGLSVTTEGIGSLMGIAYMSISCVAMRVTSVSNSCVDIGIGWAFTEGVLIMVSMAVGLTSSYQARKL